MPIAITGTGLFTPPFSITNEELVASFNMWVEAENTKHADAISRGELQPLKSSSTDFVFSASGIGRRYVMDREGVLDPQVMAPRLAERPNDRPSLQCEMALAAIGGALEQARCPANKLGAVIVACSNLQRAYPAIAIEVQERLGAKGIAFDMNVACSSAAFGISMARDMIASGTVGSAVVVSPEICSAHLNFRDRESHFIFGDACTAVVVEDMATSDAPEMFEILGTRLLTKFSNNIRNNSGFLARTAPEHRDDPDKLFVQQGRKVFKDVSPMVADLIGGHLDSLGIAASQIRRMWLHQANGTMNQWICRKLLGRDATAEEAPSVLEEYANTSSCGSVITFHKNRTGLADGDLALLCAFGAGYSVGNVVLRKHLRRAA